MSQGPSGFLGLELDLKNCKKNWPYNVLFVSNLTTDWLLELCFPWR